jgi:hypothetical protein
MAKSGLLPTPCARDHKGSPGQATKGGQRALGQRTRCLNPAFVEWMMGLFGWTDPMGDASPPAEPAGREQSG